MTTERDGNRTAQVLGGWFVLAVAAAMLLGHYVADAHTPKDLELYIGAGGLVIGLWLVAPVGMGRVGTEARRLWHELRGHQ